MAQSRLVTWYVQMAAEEGIKLEETHSMLLCLPLLLLKL
jgi:hypothetical protein